MIYIIGLLTGIITGMALGGGAILIPFLVFLMDVKQHMAQGITLTVFLPISVIAVLTHVKQHNVDLYLASRIILGGVLGAIIGSLLAMHIAADLLQRIYGAFLILMGIYEFYQARFMGKG